MAGTGKPNGREAKKAQAEQVLLEHAARLFAERGFGGTSLKDIADAMGLTRGAIYYYFPNKEAVVSRLVEELTVNAAKDIDAWRATAKGTVAERLAELIRRRITYVVRRASRVRLLELAEAALPENLAKRSRAAKRHILDVYTDLIREGVDDGEFRAVDERIAAFGLIGMVNWSAWWFDPSRGRSVDEVAREFSEMAVRSLVKKGGGKGRRTPTAIVDSLHEGLRELESLLPTLKRR